ncbi:polymorphic toxin-type HINT domain-containing protein [Rubripirellula lacrimiformis]|uniref:polymorphic toxin-type HINT domain-containing protein n=1 Tax=Rubripirellula lacrimiformis TaxID=1930273 RepID=UPI001C54DDBB|nr:polymorphic toxin-type HINT domain-containing protein [Rubripirellula lacrimiformis]
MAHNPEVGSEEREGWVEPDWSNYLKLSLVMPKDDGSELKMELLRSEDWVRSQLSWLVDEAEAESNDLVAQIQLLPINAPDSEFERDRLNVPLSPMRPVFRELLLTNATIELQGWQIQSLLVEMDLPELAITGSAIVTDIQSAPMVKSGQGRVVTATFHHSSGDVIDLTISDNLDAETIGTTSNHPFWSVDRQEYVQAGRLDKGERVRTYHGDTKRVVSKLARPGPQAVYNMEVHGEHVYYVGDQGLLVHNSQTYDFGGGVAYTDSLDDLAPNRGGLGLGRFAREMNADASTRRVLNQTRGRVFDDVAGQSVDGRFIDLQSEVTIRPFVDANGTLAGRGFRADRLGIDVESFATRPLEFKSSFRAPLTKGQRQGFPLFEQFGGQVRGHGGGLAFPQGTVLDPSNVLTIRPRDLPRAARIQFGQDLRDALIQLRSAQ